MKKIVVIIFIFSFIFSAAQVKFRKISKEELQKEQSTINPEAAAEIISKEANFEVMYNESKRTFETQKHISIRIKIYDKDKAPNELLNITIPAYILATDREKITGIRAYTYNLENGKIVEDKVKGSDIFDEEINDYVEVTKFAFPNVKNGSILEYKYNILTPRFFDLDTWYFQTDVPVQHNRFRVVYPEFFTYRPDNRGSVVGKKETDKRDTQYRFNNLVDIYVFDNVPALKDEPFVQNTNNMKTSVRYELVEYNDPGYGFENYASSWEQIVKGLNFDSDYGGQLKGNAFLNDEVAKFSGIADNEEKLATIFAYVKGAYSWNGFMGLYPQFGTRKTHKDKVGNGTDLNFILISMLQKVGLNANPVVLSTVKNGRLNFFPSKRKLNHTITGVIIGDNYYLMDPTKKYSKINMLPSMDLNFNGFMMFPNGNYLEVDLLNRLTSEVKSTINYRLEDDVFSGTFTQTRNNYFAMNRLERRDIDESHFEEDFTSSYDADITDFKFKVNPKGDAIRYTVKFEDSKSMENIGNKIFIKPLLFLKTEANAFKFRNEERKFPLEFGTPFTYLSTANMKIPEGYVVESLPEEFTFQLPQKAGGFSIKFQEKNGNILVQSLTHIGHSVLPPSFYIEIKNMFEKVIEKENEQIILVQK